MKKVPRGTLTDTVTEPQHPHRGKQNRCSANWTTFVPFSKRIHLPCICSCSKSICAQKIEQTQSKYYRCLFHSPPWGCGGSVSASTGYLFSRSAITSCEWSLTDASIFHFLMSSIRRVVMKTVQSGLIHASGSAVIVRFSLLYESNVNVS